MSEQKNFECVCGWSEGKGLNTQSVQTKQGQNPASQCKLSLLAHMSFDQIFMQCIHNQYNFGPFVS